MSRTSPHKLSQIKTARLEPIDFAKLLARDESEIAKLLSACSTTGPFYVDIQGQSARCLLEDEENMYKVMEAYFDQPLEVKMQDDRGTYKRGYKPPGIFAGVKDNRSSLLPAAVKIQMRLFDDFISKAHIVTMTIMSTLANALHADSSDHFEQHHRDKGDSNTTLVLLRYPKDVNSSCVGHNQHTDIGSLTLLFSRQWGLQIMSPETHEWDFTNGGTPTENRYSIAYFLRLGSDVTYEDPEGLPVSAKQWHDNKCQTFADTHEQQAKNSILMGEMDNTNRQGIAV
ncbi:Clavaminate synthase-like protein [Pleomassaria siparia CBS 279.74]|uniref:Clavaminate synthase-like protein n=1 Tax=Pleomassaria siparia CBS 279.74 TaxID=1314801 RepID=A0A6G1JVU2_9PLEO|nr:Clavaminate synthase-like protein [Pleomassaria siparia CBS 279.74]